jgi:hypothetical protein
VLAVLEEYLTALQAVAVCLEVLVILFLLPPFLQKVVRAVVQEVVVWVQQILTRALVRAVMAQAPLTQITPELAVVAVRAVIQVMAVLAVSLEATLLQAQVAGVEVVEMQDTRQPI